MRLILVLAASLCALVVGSASAAEPSRRTAANVMVELSFTAARAYDDPFNQVTLDVLVTDPTGRELRVPAFWAGGDVWKVRFASPLVGEHRYRTELTGGGDQGLHDVTGTLEVAPYAGGNPLYVHGPLRIAPNKRHLQHTDGTPFFWLGDTWWMGLCQRIRFPDEFQTLAADRKAKGFNVVQIVAGLYPDMFPFDPRGANEAGFPWEPEYKRIRPEYFDQADRRLLHLVDQGFTPCIVGAWGYYIDFMGVDRAKQHWRYLIARYGALPVVWCAAGEANLPFYGVPGFPYDTRKQVAGWTQVLRHIRDTDPFDRLLTIHPTGLARLSSRHCTDDPSLIDFDLLQTPHGTREAIPATINTVRESHADTPRMPVIDGEAAYEMLNDRLPTEWTRRMFWVCMTNGAAGHTYGANGIWQCNRQGLPHGQSPPNRADEGTGYGTIPWDQAMHLPGSTQMGIGRRLFERFRWYDFEPHPEWATFDRPPVLSFDGCKWIWFPEGNPAANAPAEKRYFRRAFDLPAGKQIRSATLRLSADDRFTVHLNGHVLGSSLSVPESWRAGRQFDDVAAKLRPGRNVLSVEAENLPAPAANPAGLIARLDVPFDDGSLVSVRSDATWSSANRQTEGWNRPDLDDAAWPKVTVLGDHGNAPWGRIDPSAQDGIFGPQSCGIPTGVRLTYVPDPQPVAVHKLPVGVEYSASWLDPVTGTSTDLPPIRADEAGRAICPAPDGHDHDWILVLQSRQ